jgi:cytoskeleton protein RodZ
MMDTPDVVANPGKELAPQESVLDVGMALREAREGLGLSVHDIANRIKFAARQVEALEANDFEHLPQATFLRGFVRSYARVLQLDEMALIAALPSEPVKQVVTKAATVDVSFPNIFALQRVNLLWLAGALGVVLVLGLFVLLHDSEPLAKPAELVVEPVPLLTPASGVPATADAEVQPKTPEVVEVAEPIKKPEPVPVKKPEPVKAKPPVTIAVPPVSATEENINAVTPEILKRRPLHFVFIKDAWAEVIDARGSVLMSRNNSRGTEKWIGGPRRAPYDISISRPANVRLYYKGQQIDLSAYAAMEVAHLKVE